MSWQGTFDGTQLVTSGKIHKAAILGQAGGVWAQSPNYDHTLEDQAALTRAFNNLDKLRAEGLHLKGKKYVTMTADDDEIHVRQRGGTDGLLIAKTKQAIIVAEYVAPVQAAEANAVVAGVADYFKGVGY